MVTKNNDAEKPATLNLTKEDLQELMIAVQTASIQAQHDIKDKPTPLQIARLAKEKEHWAELTKQTVKTKEDRERACSHRRPEDGLSLFWQMNNVYPQGAVTLVCCRCFKLVQNYAEHKLVDNPDFQKWYGQPTRGVMVG